MTQPPAAVSIRPNADAAARENDPPFSHRAPEFDFRILTGHKFSFFLVVLECQLVLNFISDDFSFKKFG